MGPRPLGPIVYALYIVGSNAGLLLRVFVGELVLGGVTCGVVVVLGNEKGERLQECKSRKSPKRMCCMKASECSNGKKKQELLNMTKGDDLEERRALTSQKIVQA